MWFMYLVSWLAFLLQVSFITLSIAAGLYYLAEIVEEYTVMAGKAIKYLIWLTSLVYIGFIIFESLSLSLTLVGLVSNGVYLLLLNNFPFIELSSPIFLFSLVLIAVNHYLSFSYFASVYHPFTEVLAFFTVCQWLVPFAFFVSLSANENVLPTFTDSAPQENEGDLVSSYFNKKSKRYGLLSFLKSAQDTILPQRVKKGF